MSHDIDDLLEMIKELEERIRILEIKKQERYLEAVRNDDAWYWEHG